MASVDALISDARNFASSTIASAVTQLNAAIGEANGLGRTIGGADLPTINLTPPEPGDPGAVPQSTTEGFRDPGLNAAAPILINVPTLDIGGEPGLPPSVLGFEDPRTQPVGEAGDPALLQNAPEFDPADVEIPDAPDLMERIAGIPKPTITPITIPAAPTYREPQFLGHSPGAAPAAPTGLDTKLRNAYLDISPVMRDAVTAQVDGFINSEFPSFRTGLAAIEDRLATYLEGGSALTSDVQDAILARAANKTDAEFRREYSQAVTAAAKMGQTIVGPTLYAKLQEVQHNRYTANAQATRDLMIEIARMEQANLQFAVTQSANMRGTMINAALNYYSGLIQINGQALDYARAIVDTIVKVYDTAARQKEIEARIYEAEANIFDAKVKGALGAIEAYNAEVRGLEAQANVDTAMVNAYKAQVDAVQAEANVYRAQIDGLTAKTQISRLLVDIYQARVQAYGAQVNSYTAQWQGYRAAVEGAVAGIQASVEQVKGFTAQSENYRAIIGARTAQIEGITKGNDGLLKNYQTAVEAYKVRVEALSTVQKSQIESFQSTIAAFVAKANAISERSRADIAHFEAGLRAVVASFEMYFRLLHENHDLDVERVKSIASLSTSAANTYAGLAQSAASGLNTLVAQVAQQ